MLKGLKRVASSRGLLVQSSLVFRRSPFALPCAEHIPALTGVLDGAELVAPEDPAAFVEAAVAHRVVGAATAALQGGRLALPAAAAQQLRDAHAVGALRSALVRRELALVARPLSAAVGAPAIVLKGPAIADRFYPDPAWRSFADLDLLVPRARLDDAVSALRDLGYEEHVELREGFGATHGHDVHMARRVGRHRADVELHWRVGDDVLGEALDHDTLMAGSVAADAAATAAETARSAQPRYLDAGAQLLVCSMHLLSDRLRRLIWIEDLRRISRSLDEDEWRRTFERASALGLLWVLNRALDYASHHLAYRRERPLPVGEPPPWGPLRAVEALSFPAALHLGRLATLPWRARPQYLRGILFPTRAGLRGTVGTDGAGPTRMAARHLGRAVRGLAPRR